MFGWWVNRWSTQKNTAEYFRNNDIYFLYDDIEEYPQWMQWIAEKFGTDTVIPIYSINIESQADLERAGKLHGVHRLWLKDAEDEYDLSAIDGLFELEELEISSSVRSVKPLRRLKNLKKLSIDQSNSADLSSLKYLESLEHLSIGESSFASLEFLRGLSQMRVLRIGCWGVKDISPLQEMKNLNSLTLFGVQADDYQLFSTFISLNELNLVGSNIEDLTPISNLIWLEDVKLNRTKVSDITPLKNLTRINHLDISGTNVDDLSPLKELTGIYSLGVSNTPANDFSVLSHLPGVSRLNIWGEKVTGQIRFTKNSLKYLNIQSAPNVSSVLIEESPQLEDFEVRKTGIQKIEGLENCEILREVELNSSPIESLRLNGQRIYSFNVSDCPLSEVSLANANVYSLALKNTKLKNLEGFKDIKGATELELAGKSFTSLDGVTNRWEVRDLIIRDTNIVSLEPFPELHKLETVELENSPIVDISKMKVAGTAKGLSRCVIKNCPITDIAPLLTPHIKELSLDGTRVASLAPFSKTEPRILKKLSIRNSTFSDLSPLAKNDHVKQNLRWLDLSGTKVMDLGPVAELKSLEGLILNDSEVKDLTPLADSLCTDLELVNCQAADLSPIGQMKNLKHLTIRNCDASDFEFLADLKKLTYLDLSGTTFANGSSLVGLEKLKYLDLSNTRLKNHDQLKGLKSLIMIIKEIEFVI